MNADELERIKMRYAIKQCQSSIDIGMLLAEISLLENEIEQIRAQRNSIRDQFAKNAKMKNILADVLKCSCWIDESGFVAAWHEKGKLEDHPIIKARKALEGGEK